MSEKTFKTHNSQLRILRSRGLNVKSNAKRALEKENYYNVINGYKDLFLDHSATTETYKTGADFSEIFALYEFDRELRFIFLKRLLKIENQIKTVVSYKFSERYSHDNYLKLSNFKPHNNDKKTLQNIMNVIATFEKTIADQCGKHSAVNHYMTEHGYVPLWVLANVLTFGNISRFFGVLKLEDRHSIAKEFNLPENYFMRYLEVMTIFRNVCAHDERLYNYKINTEIKSGPIHRQLDIPKNRHGKFIYGINDVFALLICVKEFLPKKTRGEFRDTVKQINKEINRLDNKIHTISIGDVLEKMGFPVNWKDI